MADVKWEYGCADDAEKLCAEDALKHGDDVGACLDVFRSIQLELAIESAFWSNY